MEEGGLWYFPAGLPHSLQGLDPDGTEFVLAFDNGDSSEFNTLLVTDWIAHTPPEVLAKNFGVPVDAFKNIPLHNKWIYQSNIPAPPLATVEAQIAAAAANRQIPSFSGAPISSRSLRRRAGRCGSRTAPTS